jgi:hypothetical protein
MKPDFAPLRVTFVDLLGALLPGMVWLVVLATLLQVVAAPLSAPTPIDTAMWLVDTGSAMGNAHLVLLLVAALAIGYGSKPLTNAPAEFLVSWMGGRFPYADDHMSHDYFTELEQLAVEVTRAQELKDIKFLHVQPFSTCKRYLRVHSPALWEEAEHAEAETRMLGSLFLAAVVSTLLVPIASVSAGKWTPAMTTAVILSVLLMVVFGAAFRRRRKREVSIVYLNTLITLREQRSAAAVSNA